MRKLRGKKRSAKRSARRVRIGVPDGSLTALAGLAAVDEVTARLGIVGALDRGIGPIKQRARGLTGGQLLLGWRRRNWPARTASRGWTGSGPTRAAPC